MKNSELKAIELEILYLFYGDCSSSVEKGDREKDIEFLDSRFKYLCCDKMSELMHHH